VAQLDHWVTLGSPSPSLGPVYPVGLSGFSELSWWSAAWEELEQGYSLPGNGVGVAGCQGNNHQSGAVARRWTTWEEGALCRSASQAVGSKVTDCSYVGSGGGCVVRGSRFRVLQQGFDVGVIISRIKTPHPLSPV
jgi:hypothetical protein